MTSRILISSRAACARVSLRHAGFASWKVADPLSGEGRLTVDRPLMHTRNATGALVPRERSYQRDRSTVVALDPAHDLTATTSKFWGVTWAKRQRR